MIGGLKNKLVGGAPIISKTIGLNTVESEIASSLTRIQNNNKDVEIGSYPFFKSGKVGVSIVMRSENEIHIDKCVKQIEDFIKIKNIKILNNE